MVETGVVLVLSIIEHNLHLPMHSLTIYDRKLSKPLRDFSVDAMQNLNLPSVRHVCHHVHAALYPSFTLYRLGNMIIFQRRQTVQSEARL